MFYYNEGNPEMQKGDATRLGKVAAYSTGSVSLWGRHGAADGVLVSGSGRGSLQTIGGLNATDGRLADDDSREDSAWQSCST